LKVLAAWFRDIVVTTEGVRMRFLRTDGASRSSDSLIAVGITVMVASGCAGADAALADGECNQTDSTVTCCLKMNPGQYERCGVSPPPQPIERINAAIPKLPTRKEKERWRKDICTPAYDRCIDAGGGSIEGRVWDETQCKACFEACMRYGSWPKEANDKPCPGA
jgi:hypothetical protein